MNSAEVTRWVNNNREADASGLLNEKFPTMSKRLTRVAKKLIELLEEVKTEFPDAMYYTASGGFNLLLGYSHGDDINSKNTYPHPEREAWGSIGLDIGDGDY